MSAAPDGCVLREPGPCTPHEYLCLEDSGRRPNWGWTPGPADEPQAWEKGQLVLLGQAGEDCAVLSASALPALTPGMHTGPEPPDLQSGDLGVGTEGDSGLAGEHRQGGGLALEPRPGLHPRQLGPVNFSSYL